MVISLKIYIKIITFVDTHGQARGTFTDDFLKTKSVPSISGHFDFNGVPNGIRTRVSDNSYF